MLRILIMLIIAMGIQGCGLMQRIEVEEQCDKTTQSAIKWYDVVISGQKSLRQIEKEYTHELWKYFIDLMKREPRPERPEMQQKIKTKCMALTYPDEYGPKYNPRIGMSKAEVERSTWGKPSIGNTRSMTTQYGKTECWFYGDYSRRAICFGSDGLVSNITE